MAKITVVKLGGTKSSSNGTEPCRVCHGTGRQKTPKKKKKN